MVRDSRGLRSRQFSKLEKKANKRRQVMQKKKLSLASNQSVLSQSLSNDIPVKLHL